MARGEADPPGVLHRLFHRRDREVFLQDFRIADDGVEWRPEFVAHIGEECALGFIGVLCRLTRLAQRLDGLRQGAVACINFLQQMIEALIKLGEAIIGADDHIAGRRFGQRAEHADDIGRIGIGGQRRTDEE